MTGTTYSSNVGTGIILSTGTTANPVTIANGVSITTTGSAGHRNAIYGDYKSAWTVSNYGVIQGVGTPTNSGIFLKGGGSVTNGSSAASDAYISGTTGVAITGAVGTVSNYGTILSPSVGPPGAGVYLANGGTVNNASTGVILSGGAGVIVGGSYVNPSPTAGRTGVVTNFGIIVSAVTFSGVVLFSGGTVANYGTITSTGPAGGSGIFLASGGGTIIDSGSIIGNSGTAVNLGSGVAELVINPGAYISGVVSNFNPGDVIDFAGIAASGANFSSDFGSVVLLNNGTPVDELAVNFGGSTRSVLLTSDGAGGTDVTASAAVAPADFNGDINSDIVLQNTNGQLFLYAMQGSSVIGGGNIGNYGSTWHVAAVGNVNGDGNPAPDIVLQDSASGQIYLLEMSGADVVGGGNVGNFGTDWSVKGIGDLGGAGTADIVLQNTDGQIYVLEMSGASVVGGGSVGNFGADWLVASVSVDNADIVLQNTNGQIYLLEMNGPSVTGGGNLGNYGAEWHVKGVGDFGGTSNDDLLLQNTDGQLYVLQLTGAAVTGSANFSNYGSDWQAEAVADYYGNGVSDIALQNTNGQIYLLEASGTTLTGSGNVGNPGNTWHLQGTG